MIDARVGLFSQEREETLYKLLGCNCASEINGLLCEVSMVRGCKKVTRKRVLQMHYHSFEKSRVSREKFLWIFSLQNIQIVMHFLLYETQDKALFHSIFFFSYENFLRIIMLCSVYALKKFFLTVQGFSYMCVYIFCDH